MPIVTLPPGVRMTAALLKQIIEECGTCDPCGSGSGSGHGNPGCCTGWNGLCPSCWRWDYSWLLSGCSLFGACVSGTGYYEDKTGCGGIISQSSTVTDAQNFDTSDACSFLGLGSGTIGIGIQAMCYNSNLDPLSGLPIDKTQDAWYILTGFTCFDDRMMFCATALFYQGVTPAPTINPQLQLFFNQDVLSFSAASCGPFIFSVSNLAPYQTDLRDGLTGGGASIPLTSSCSGSPLLSATWTGRCLP